MVSATLQNVTTVFGFQNWFIPNRGNFTNAPGKIIKLTPYTKINNRFTFLKDIYKIRIFIC